MKLKRRRTGINFSLLLILFLLPFLLFAEVSGMYDVIYIWLIFSTNLFFMVFQFRMWRLIKVMYKDVLSINFAIQSPMVNRNDLKERIINLILIILLVSKNVHSRVDLISCIVYSSVVLYLILKIEMAKARSLKMIINTIIFKIWKIILLLIEQAKIFGSKISNRITELVKFLQLKFNQIFLIRQSEQKFKLKHKYSMVIDKISNGDYI